MAGEHYMAVDLSTPAKAVEHGARVMEKAEGEVAKLRETVPKLADVIEAGRGFGWVGDLEAGEMTADALAIAGLAAEVERRLYALHRRCTDIAKKNGVDLPQRKGGGNR